MRRRGFLAGAAMLLALRHEPSAFAAATCLLGAWPEMNGDGVWSPAEATQFDQLSQARMRLGLHYQSWGGGFAVAAQEYQAGRFPHFAWGNSTRWGADITIPRIAAGMLDDEIHGVAVDIASRAQGRRFQFRPLWEMNGKWSKWNASTYGNDASMYVDAWRRMATIMRATAPTAELVWAPSWQSNPDEPWNDMRGYYPGDLWVDRIGVSAYNGYPAKWIEFPDIVAEASAVSPVPLMCMTEGASVEDRYGKGTKSGWITHMRDYVKAHPRWRELIWFHRPAVAKEPTRDYRVNTTPASLAAWRAMCGDPYFGG